MSTSSFRMKQILAVATVAAALSHAVSVLAQHFQPFGPVDFNPDFQLFAPADLGDVDEPPQPSEGYFFVYERLNWAIDGVRTPTGRKLPIFRSIDHFPGGPFPPTLILNSLDEDVPRNEFTWGNRFDMGYLVDDHGWLVSVLDTHELDQRMTYGYLPGNNPDFPASTNPPETDPNAPFGTNPLGSVAIIFKHPLGLMDGFIDVIVAEQMGVQRDNIGDTFADDVDGDGIHGPDGLDTDGDGVPDTILGIPTDFDDLVTFLPTFRTVTTRSITEMNGVELMKMYRLPMLHGGSVCELYYGARYWRFRDIFNVSTTGGTLGLSNWDTRVINNVVGPQVGGRLSNQRGRWKLILEGRFLAGYNIENLRQIGNIGGNLVAGAHNSPMFFNPTTFRHGRQDEDFSPIGELRAETTFQVTRAMALKLGWTGIYAANLARASSVVDYTLPDMGLLNYDPEDVFTNGVTFGVEINR